MVLLCHSVTPTCYLFISKKKKSICFTTALNKNILFWKLALSCRRDMSTLVNNSVFAVLCLPDRNQRSVFV